MADFIERKFISIEQGEVLVDRQITKAKELRIFGGVALAMDPTRLVLAYKAYGTATENNTVLAGLKAETVLNMRRTTSIQNARNESRGLSWQDFPGRMKTSLLGGVAIFSHEWRYPENFAGVIAFSGGTPQQDEEIGRAAAWKQGLYSDLGVSLLTSSTMTGRETAICFVCGHNDSMGVYKGYQVSTPEDSQIATNMFREGSARPHTVGEPPTMFYVVHGTCNEHVDRLKSFENLLKRNGNYLIPEIIQEVTETIV